MWVAIFSLRQMNSPLRMMDKNKPSTIPKYFEAVRSWDEKCYKVFHYAKTGTAPHGLEKEGANNVKGETKDSVQ